MAKEEFRCFFCEGQADRLMYYSKLYQHAGGTVENPLLSCESCRKRAYDNLAQVRGGCEGVKTVLLKDISKFTPMQMGFLVSKKREINHLACVRWRKILWRIHFVFQESKAHHESNTSGSPALP